MQAAHRAPDPSGPVPGGVAPPAGYAAPDYAAPDYDNAYRQPYETQPQPYPYPQADAAPDYTAVYAAPGGSERAPDFLSQPAYDQQAYDDEPPHADGSTPRRRMVVLAAAAVALVVGTAGAFGYRALFGSSGSAPPPVIKADTAPSKIVPAAQRDAAGGKAIQDRIGERSGNERVVSREEQPMELKPQPRVVFPSGAPGASGVAAATPASPTEPKKIRTVSIRPDQPMGMEQAAPPPAQAAAPPVRTASVAAAGDAVASAPPPVAVPARPAVPAHTNHGPLSLSPNAAAPSATAPATRTASVPPRAAAAPAGSGAYVQVSSQRSEADAQASFRALQAKYPSVLGSDSVSVRRADLGAKGTYYRAMIGPLAGADAVTLCGNLKAAGGSCIIQKN